MKIRVALALVVHLFAIAALGDEDSTAEYFESIRRDPLLLRRFLEQMPKGGDLHNHLSGTVYPGSTSRARQTPSRCCARWPRSLSQSRSVSPATT